MSDLLIATAQPFYSQLANNNTKAWWDEHRATYDNTLKPEALALLDRLAPKLSELIGEEVKTKLFRPHRDVRFSKDKTPYKPHLHMMWQVIDPTARQAPVYFLGIGVDYVTAGAGMMGFDKPVLEDWRKFIDLDRKRIGDIFDDLTHKDFVFRDPALKRVPSPFAPDHPLADYLRMKGCVASRDLGMPEDIELAVLRACKQLTPLNHLLLQIASA